MVHSFINALHKVCIKATIEQMRILGLGSLSRYYSTIRIVSHELDHGSIAQMILDRPQAKNAISKQLLDEMHTYILDLKTQNPSVESIQTLIISSSLPDVFCAGADLKQRKTFSPHETAMFLYKLNATLNLIQSLPIPTISSVQGLALGGGLELALSTDFRVLSEKSQVGLPETRLAIIPGAGGTRRLPQVIGYSRALDMILTGRRVNAQEALMFGLANRVAADADQEAVNFAKQICSGGPLAIKAAKEAVKGCSVEWEQVGYRQVVNSKDKFEALDAFANKRSPVFRGK